MERIREFRHSGLYVVLYSRKLRDYSIAKNYVEYRAGIWRGNDDNADNEILVKSDCLHNQKQAVELFESLKNQVLSGKFNA